MTSMASDWHRRGGKTLDGVGRALARKGLDILDMVGVKIEGDYLNGSRSVVPGEVRDTVEATLGTRKFKEICKKYTVLENIHYCQSGITQPHISLPLCYVLLYFDISCDIVAGFGFQSWKCGET